jgi:hypothetical protein
MDLSRDGVEAVRLMETINEQYELYERFRLTQRSNEVVFENF